MATRFTYRDVGTVIEGIRDHWPGVASLPELGEVEAMLPAGGAELDQEVSAAVREAVAALEIILGHKPPPPPPLGSCQSGIILAWPFGVCERVFPTIWPPQG